MEAFQKVSTLLTKQKGNQGHAPEMGGYGDATDPDAAEAARGRSSRQEDQPLASPPNKEPVHSAGKQVLRSSEQSRSNRRGGLPIDNGRDQRDSMRSGSEDEDEDITNPFITDKDGNNGGIATVTSTVNIGTTGQGFQSSDFKLGS